MKVECWVKEIYGDSMDVLEELGTRDLPLGKRVLVDSKGEPHEIDVVGPDVENAKYCPYNVCPPGSVRVGLACLTDVVMKPYDNGCPNGYAVGERTDTIDMVGEHGKLWTGEIIENEGSPDNPNGSPDYGEGQIAVPQPRVVTKTTDVCVLREPMPLTEENIKLVTDSIIGWGGYQEFPYWDVPWSMMNDLADDRYYRGAKMAGRGYAVRFYDYPDYDYFVFSDRKDAEAVKKTLKYYESNKAYEDTKKFLIEDEGIPPEEVTDEVIAERLNFELQSYLEDMDDYPSYLGVVNPYQRAGEMYGEDGDTVFVALKTEDGKQVENIIVGEEI